MDDQFKEKMRFLHISNTDLEFELVEDPSIPLEKSLRRNPIIHQLQFLPLLYTEKEDGLGVTDFPYPSIQTPLCHLFSETQLPYDRVESWAPSLRIAHWAKSRELLYSMPAWEIVKAVNSKAFSFQEVEPLPEAELIQTWDQLQTWIERVQGPKVLKTCFGVSGRGHLHLPASSERIETFALREFKAFRPLIAEPWVTRKLDFSTQWIISEKEGIEYIGATVLQSDSQGHYAGNQVGDEEKIFGYYCSHLKQHKASVQTTLQKMQKMGFFGNVGIDAMIWGDDYLHSIVEINARKTMGWISLQIRKRLFPNQTIKVSYVHASRRLPLLPQGTLMSNGVLESFSRNLYVDVLAI